MQMSLYTLTGRILQQGLYIFQKKPHNSSAVSGVMKSLLKCCIIVVVQELMSFFRIAEFMKCWYRIRFYFICDF